MAENNEIQGLVVKVGITDDLFTEGISKINKSMKLLQSEFKASQAGLEAFGNDSEKLANKQEYLSKSIELQKAKIQALKDAYDKSKSSTGEFSNATVNAGTKLNNAIAYMSKLQKELKDIDETLENSKKELGESTGAWENFRDKISNITKGMGESIKNGIGMAIGHDIWDKFKEGSDAILTFGSDYQKATNHLQTNTGYVNDAMTDLKKSMLEIYNDNFGENFDDIGKALKVVGQQFLGNSKDIKQVTEDALLLRDTFGFEVNESFRSANMLIEQFGLSGDEAYNLIAQGAQFGLDKNGDLLDTINEYSVQFKGLGLNSEDMFNMLVNGASNGTFSVDKLGDAVKEFGIRAKDGSSTTQDAFQKLGLNVQETEKKFAKGGDTAKQAFQDVNKKLLEMKDPLQQNQVGVELWGSMWEDLGKSGIQSLTNLNGQIGKTSDTLKDINKIQYNDLGSATEGIKRQIETGILVPLSEKLLPKLNDFSTWFNSHMPEIKQKISETMDKVLPMIDNLGKAFNLIKDNINIIIPVVGALAFTLGMLAVIETIQRIMLAWNTVVQVATGIQWLWNAALDANPIGLIIIAIAGVIAILVTLYEKSETFRKFVDGLFSGIKDFANNVKEGFDFVKKHVEQRLGEMKKAYDEHGGGLKGAFFAAMEGVKGTVADAYNGINNLTGGKLEEVRKGAAEKLEGLKGHFKEGFDFIKGHVQERLGDMKKAYDEHGGGMQGAFFSALEGVKGYYTDIFDGINKLTGGKLGDIKDKIVSKWDDIKSWFAGFSLKKELEKIFDFDIPHIKLPHFSLKGSFDLMKGQIPSLDVNWYDKGGIFSSPTVIGVGEKRPEFVGALEDLRYLIGSELDKRNGNAQPVTVNFNGSYAFADEKDIDYFMNRAALLTQRRK
ncbi:MAG: phage tail tape measure protein [Bacillota bacterium]|nr:phage tail tape measure protein [Bacillota bacterium]